MRSVLLLFTVAILLISCKEEDEHKIHLEDYNHPVNSEAAFDQKPDKAAEPTKEAAMDSTAVDSTKKTMTDSTAVDSAKAGSMKPKKDSAA